MEGEQNTRERKSERERPNQGPNPRANRNFLLGPEYIPIDLLAVFDREKKRMEGEGTAQEGEGNAQEGEGNAQEEERKAQMDSLPPSLLRLLQVLIDTNGIKNDKGYPKE